MASDGAKWSKDEINALIDAYSNAKMSADSIATNRELYSLLEMAAQVSVTICANCRALSWSIWSLKCFIIQTQHEQSKETVESNNQADILNTERMHHAIRTLSMQWACARFVEWELHFNYL